MDEKLTLLFKNLLRTGRQHNQVLDSFFIWLGSCLHANRSRKQLANTLGGHDDIRQMEQQSKLASDGFLNNLASLVVRLCGPLLKSQATTESPKSPINFIKPDFVVSEKVKRVLPGKSVAETGT